MDKHLKQQCIEALIERVKDTRWGAERDVTIAEIRLLQMHSADWPNATVAEWNTAADSAIEQGLLREEFEDCRKLYYVEPQQTKREPARKAGPTRKESNPQQLDLFAV